MLVLPNRISIGVDSTTGYRMLHFSHVTSDLGAGPFEIDRAYDPATCTATFQPGHLQQPVRRQLVLRSQRSAPHRRQVVQPSDYTFPLNSFSLNTRNPDATTGPVVARSPKTEYCITGDYIVGGVANTPNQTFIPASNCGDPKARLGWSVGWGDLYDQTDDGQR